MDTPVNNVVILTGTVSDEEDKGAYLFTPHLIASLSSVEQIVRFGVGVTAQHSMLISQEGAVWGIGRNGFGQLGLKACEAVKQPREIKSLSGYKIVRAAAGRHHSIFVTDDGKVLSCGKNAQGQLGRTSKDTDEPKLIPALAGTTIIDVACGESNRILADFSVAVDSTGRLWSWGSPEYGQLGGGSDHQTIQARKAVFTPQSPSKIGGVLAEVKITKVTCGTNHCVALSDKGEVYTWGFGGYGRLGHKVQKDEFRPKKIDPNQTRGFYPVTDIASGSTFNLAVGAYGVLYVWGRPKATGDSIMVPSVEQGLSGWKTNLMSCGNLSLVVQADDKTIGWGNGTHGELGFGDHQKSSAKPDIIEKLNDIKIKQIGCSALHTLFIAEESKQTSALPVYQEAETEASVETSSEDVSSSEESEKAPKKQTKKTTKKGEEKEKKPKKPTKTTKKTKKEDEKKETTETAPKKRGRPAKSADAVPATKKQKK